MVTVNNKSCDPLVDEFCILCMTGIEKEKSIVSIQVNKMMKIKLKM